VLSFRIGKTFRERTFALHHQQPDKDQQNVDVAPPGKISVDAHASSSDVPKSFLSSQSHKAFESTSSQGHLKFFRVRVES